MKQILIAVLFLALCCTACSTAWVTTLDSILAAAAPALIDILEIVAAANDQVVNAAQVSKINTDAAAIKSLASDFASASLLAAPGVCSQLQASIAAYQSDQQLVLSAAQVSDANTQMKITLLSNLVEGTVDAVLAVIPSCQAAKIAMPLSAPPLSLMGFVTSYNAILTTKTGDAAVDTLTPNLKLYRHSRILRALTLGRLQ
jgi:hypothetical protein